MDDVQRPLFSYGFADVFPPASDTNSNQQSAMPQHQHRLTTLSPVQLTGRYYGQRLYVAVDPMLDILHVGRRLVMVSMACRLVRFSPRAACRVFTSSAPNHDHISHSINSTLESARTTHEQQQQQPANRRQEHQVRHVGPHVPCCSWLQSASRPRGRVAQASHHKEAHSWQCISQLSHLASAGRVEFAARSHEGPA
jgi:hypothetical protein